MNLDITYWQAAHHAITVDAAAVLPALRRQAHELEEAADALRKIETGGNLTPAELTVIAEVLTADGQLTSPAPAVTAFGYSEPDDYTVAVSQDQSVMSTPDELPGEEEVLPYAGLGDGPLALLVQLMHANSQQNYELMKSLHEHAGKELTEARREITDIRQAVKTLFSLPFLPHPDDVTDALYPDTRTHMYRRIAPFIQGE